MKILNSADTALVMNQIYKNVTGTTTTADGTSEDGALVKEDLSNLADAGKILSNELTIGNFRNAVTGMLEGVGLIMTENAKVSSPSRFGLNVTTSEFLTIVEKVRIDSVDFEESYILANSGGSSFEDMFNKHDLTFTVKVWNTITSFRTKPYTIDYETLASSVRSPEQLARIIGEIFAVIETTYRIALRGAETRIVMAQMANCALYRNGVNVIDVLAEFKKQTGTTLTKETMHNSDAFKRWFYGFIKHLKITMAEPTGNFNAVKNLINTDDEDRRFFMLEPFATSLETIAHNTDASNKFNALSDCIQISYIQNINEPSSIDVVPVEPPVLTPSKHVTGVKMVDIIGMIWDRRGTMLASTDIKTGVNENNFDDWTNYIHNFKVRQMVDNGSNAVVLVAHDASASAENPDTLSYVITQENDA